jgi:uncharacterized protein
MRLFILLILSGFANVSFAQSAGEPITLLFKNDSLNGTLILPANAAKKFTVMLLQAGSGPTDRNGNSGPVLQTNAYLLIANALAKENIGVLLMDKRGVASSNNTLIKEADFEFEDYVTDLTEWVKLLKKDRRVKDIFIAGHSEGALVGLLAAQQQKVKGYISIEGTGERIDKTLVWQITQQSPKIGAETDSLLQRLRNGQKIDTVPPYLFSVLRPSIQPYFFSWMKFDPCTEIAKLKIPILIIQGTTDLQTVQKQGETLKACAPKSTYFQVTGMNHILKDAPSDRTKNIATYKDIALPLSAGLTNAIVRFIKMKR